VCHMVSIMLRISPGMISEERKRALRRAGAIAFGLAMAVRLMLIAAATAKAGINLREYFLLHDGWEYMRLCLGFSGHGFSHIGAETLRLYPGYPMIMILCGGFQFPGMAGIGISVLSAAACCLLICQLEERECLPFFMALVHPSWLVFSATVMSEGLSVALTLGALALLMRRQRVVAALLAGVSAVVRPVGVFLVAITAYCHWRENRGRGLWKVVLAGLLPPAAHLIIYRLVFGDMMQSVRAYAAKDFAWPFVSILRNMSAPEMEGILKFYIFFSVIFGMAGTIGLYRRYRREGERFMPLLLWNGAVLLFYLFLPSSWTFRCLDRFYLSLYPTSLIGLLPWFPKRRGLAASAIVFLAVISFFMALRWLVNLSALYPFAERALPAALLR